SNTSGCIAAPAREASRSQRPSTAAPAASPSSTAVVRACSDRQPTSGTRRCASCCDTTPQKKSDGRVEMKRYEYIVIDTAKHVEQELNDLACRAGRWSA